MLARCLWVTLAASYKGSAGCHGAAATMQHCRKDAAMCGNLLQLHACKLLTSYSTRQALLQHPLHSHARKECGPCSNCSGPRIAALPAA
jgi:hypothetical protein